jgi:Tfp pilus assembly protein PilF
VTPAQLPAPVAGFVGRQDQLAALAALVSDGPVPAGSTIAITGTAGVGKTALAVSWAHMVAGRFPDGQPYANLRGFDAGGAAADPADVLGGFLEALQVPAERVPADPQARTGLYRSLLAGRRMLIVLDNARDAHQVRPLLTGTSGSLVVVTSRDQLTGLVAADGAHPITVDVMSPAEAHQLLTRRLGPDRLAAEPAAATEIIDRCARLPLALAIAAARAASQPRLPLRRLAEQLRGAHDRLDAFTVGDGAVDIRAVLSWSYHALTPPAARLFRLLAMHPGPDLSAAAAASLAGLPLQPAGASVAELTRAHLVTEHRPGRYAFHDLLRVYAADLVGTQEPDPARRAAVHRLLDHYLHTAHAAYSLLPAQHPPASLHDPQPDVTVEPLAGAGAAREWFIAESAALAALVDRASQTGFDPYVWRLAVLFTDVLDQQGHWQDWLSVMRAAVAAAGRAGDRREEARAHRHLARAFTRLTRYPAAHTSLERALQLHRAAGDEVGLADTLLTLAFLCDRQGRHREALGHARQVQDLYRAAGYRYGLARALNNVGWLHAKVDEYRQGLDHCQQALALFQEQDDQHGQAYAWDSLGYIHHQLGRYDRAVDCYQQALALLRGIGDRPFEASALARLGDVHEAAGDNPAARAAWSEALAILRDLDHPDAHRLSALLRTPVTAMAG